MFAPSFIGRQSKQCFYNSFFATTWPKVTTLDIAAMLGDNQAFTMAASRDVPDVNIQYSDYFAGLEGHQNPRYQEEISVCCFKPYALRKKWFLQKHRAAAQCSKSRYCELFGTANLMSDKNPNEGLQIDGRIQIPFVWLGENSLHWVSKCFLISDREKRTDQSKTKDSLFLFSIKLR